MADRSTKKGRSILSRAWLLFLVTALGPIFAIAVFLGWREYSAAKKLESFKRLWANQRLPYNNETLQNWYDSTISRQGADELSAAIDFASSSWLQWQSYDLPHVGSGNELTARTCRERNWQEFEQAKAMLDHFAPNLEAIHNLKNSPAPVWQPIAFNGFGTLLGSVQDSRSLFRLLLLEADVAIYEQDRERFVSVVETLIWLTQATNSKTCFVADFVTIAFARMSYSAMQKSIECGLWDDATGDANQQLESLSQLISKPHYNTQDWQAVIQNEMALSLGSMQSVEKLGMGASGHLYKLPSVQLAYVDLMNAAKGEPIDSDGYLSAQLQAAAGIDSEVSTGMLLASLAPGMQSIVNAYITNEDHRRLALTANAIQQYRNKHNRLPESLSDLKVVGLKPEDWRTVQLGEFGYTQTDDAVLLWSASNYRQVGSRMIYSLPSLDEMTESYLRWKASQSSNVPTEVRSEVPAQNVKAKINVDKTFLPFFWNHRESVVVFSNHIQ